MKIILANGPPYSGKDTICKHYYLNSDNCIFERFSLPLKTSFAAITNTLNKMNAFYENSVYEPIKEEILPWLGVSYRQYQIDYSEKFLKPLYGNDIFGKLFIERLANYRKDDVIVVPDSGFKIEVDCLEKSDIDPKDILLIRVHREGYDFSKDSREYVYSDKFFSVDLLNNGTLEDFQEKSYSLINQFLSGYRYEDGGIGILSNGGTYY